MKNKFKTPKFTVQLLVSLAMLIALRFALGRFSWKIIPKQLTIGPSFVANTIIGSIAGPWLSFITFFIYDIVSYTLSGGTEFNIFWTLMEAFQGLLYGYFFYQKKLNFNKKADWYYVTLAVLTIMLAGSFVLQPLLTQIFYKVPFWAQYAVGRWIKVFEWPIRVFITMLVVPQLQRIPEVRRLTGIKQ